MRARVYHGPGAIGFETVPDPQPQETSTAIVKISLCGICGSDLHPYHNHPGRSGYCIGHEAVGEVVEVGSSVTRFRTGDRVLLPGSLGCGECAPCRADQVILCERHGVRIYGQGIDGIGGCQAEAVSVPQADFNLRLLQDGMSDELGIMLTDNLATAWYAARRAGVRAGDTVAVIGLGSVGLQCVMAAFAMGAEQVFAIDLLPERRAIAATLGAIPVEGDDIPAVVRHHTGGKGVRIVLDASGGPVTTVMAIEMVQRGGTVSVVGVSEAPSIGFPIDMALRKNLSFHIGVCSIQAELDEIVAALNSGRLSANAVEAIISHRLPLSEGSAAYRLFDQREDGVRKVVLDPFS